MPGLPKARDRFIEKRRAVASPRSAVDHEQRPDVTRLVVGAGEALNPGVILGNKENRLVQIPLDFRGRDKRRIFKAIFSRSMPHLRNPRQVELGGLAQARGHGDQVMPANLIQRSALSPPAPRQAAPRVSNAAKAIASRGPRLAHKTNWNAW